MNGEQIFASSNGDDPKDFRLRLVHVLSGIGMVVLFGVLAGTYYLLPRDRSVLLEAVTEELTIAVRPDTSWSVAGATLCRDAPPVRSADSPEPKIDDECGVMNRVAEGLEWVNWLSGSRIALRRPGYGALTVEVLAGSNSSARNGLETFTLETGDVLNLGHLYKPLPASGQAKLGAASPSGPPVRSGSFEWRETLPFRKRPSLVGTENLHAGDVISVGLQNCQSKERVIEWITESILVVPTDSDTRGMGVVLSATDADTGFGHSLGLCLGRFGFEETFVEPRIIDRIVTDPVIYGLGGLLTAALTVFPATIGVAELMALRTRRKRSADVDKAAPESNERARVSPATTAEEQPDD